MAKVTSQTLRGTAWSYLTFRPCDPGAVAGTRHDGLVVLHGQAAGFYEVPQHAAANNLRPYSLETFFARVDEFVPPAERIYWCKGCHRQFSRPLGAVVSLVMGHHGVNAVCCDGCQKSVQEKISSGEHP